MARAEQADNDEVRATDGRVPGRRGSATRARLLSCTADLLGKTSYRDVRVIDIARAAGTSPATFYQYFPDVEHAVLVLAEQMAAEGAELVEPVDTGDWRGAGAADAARAVVDRFFSFYERHRHVFRVIDLAADEGDLRFRQLRTRTFTGLTEALTALLAEQVRDGRLGAEVDPTAAAFVVVSMLAHTAAHRYGFEFWGVRTAAITDQLSRTLEWTVTGRAAKPADGAAPSTRGGGRRPRAAPRG